MKNRNLALRAGVAFLATLLSCNTARKETPGPPAPMSATQMIARNIDSLKKGLQEGDLIVRLGDDFISDRIRFLSAQDPLYSHAGIVVYRNQVPMVCHIYPEHDLLADTVKYHPVDSFIEPSKTIRCALFRYNLSAKEKQEFVKALDQYHQNAARFDMLYDLSTDDAVYCSEMIYKSLKYATANRISCRVSHLPERMLPMVMNYFQVYKKPKNYFKKLKIMTIDNLYLMPECSLVMKLDLKTSS